MIAAGAFETTLAARGWPRLPYVVAAAFAASFALGRWRPRAAAAVAVLFAYTAPSLFTAVVGQFRLPYLVVWMAALAGAMLAASPARRWALPGRWQWPMAVWALVVAVSWPVVAMREADFTWTVLFRSHVANTGIGVLPVEAAIAVADAALIQLAGILWFDWLYATFRGGVRLKPDATSDTTSAVRLKADTTTDTTPATGDAGLARWIVAPLAASAALACLVGIYQGFVDLSFLSGGNWATLRRAAGSMADANAFGMIAALWLSGLVALAWIGARWARLWVAAAGFALAWAGLWASGSRSALLVAAAGTAVMAWTAVRNARSAAARRRLLAALAGVAIVAAVVVVFAPPAAMGPVRRAFSAIPTPTPDRLGEFAWALWDRNHYGSAATLMIRERPLVGVGVGTFNMLSTDYTALAGSRETFDNAQNWYRHQFAELGLVGSVGWALFVGLFAALLARTRGDVPATLVKGALVAFGAVSLLGVPAQSAAVTLTFWTLAFWYVALAVPPEREITPAIGWRSEAIGWGVAATLVVVHLTGTTLVAAGAMRVPERARRIGWSYSYGLYAVEQDATGTPYRWTEREAVAVVETTQPWLKLTAWVSHPDAAERPVTIRVWVDGRLALDASRRDARPARPVWSFARRSIAPGAPRSTAAPTRASSVWRSRGRRKRGGSNEHGTFTERSRNAHGTKIRRRRLAACDRRPAAGCAVALIWPSAASRTSPAGQVLVAIAA